MVLGDFQVRAKLPAQIPRMVAGCRIEAHRAGAVALQAVQHTDRHAVIGRPVRGCAAGHPHARLYVVGQLPLVTLVTKEDTGDFQKQHLLMLKEIQDGAASVGIKFIVRWDETIHDRSIRADDGWKILLGRGLDIFQKGSGSQFDIGARRQEFRQVVAFGVTYIRDASPEVS
jgi:hypothetical protein